MYAESIKIKDSIFENKTKKYLAPILKCYEDSLSKYFFSIKKVAYGVNDIIAKKCNREINNCIFILIKYNKVFPEFLKHIRTMDYYCYDYPFDAILKGKYHMVVIFFPVKYINSYEQFLKGYYSKMYNVKDIVKYFKKEDTIKILTKDMCYKDIFKKYIQTEFGYNDYIPDSHCNELDLPISQRQEIFNYHLR